MANHIFTGTGVAVVTPFSPDGSVNYNKLRELIEWQIAEGTDAIIACGTTGESSTLTDDEHIKVISCAVEQTSGRIPVIAGAGSNDTDYAVTLAKESKQAGADGLLIVTPYYNKTSQRGLVRHFNIIADSTDLPVILYNVPSRTGVDIKPHTYTELIKHPNIKATKEASGNIAAVAEILSLCGDRLDVYTGNDDCIVPTLSLGGKGCISVLANILPRQTHDICRLFFEGRIQESADLQIKLMNLIKLLFTDVNPIPVKEALDLMGKQTGACRMPLIEADQKLREDLKKEMKLQGII
ncbi:MAG: 4-hydroxy-tetrahydrodipicolinate synthase [Oscillospiraceae bacterium]|nr:4-hydroxy-tetrahydrodipicolinate synthase [Oscillospiraceae bacterium]